MEPKRPAAPDGAAPLRQLLAAPAFLLIVATQLGLTGVIALSSFVAVADPHSSLMAWFVAAAVTVAAGGVCWLVSRWLWRALSRSNALVIASWIFAAATVLTSQLTFAVLRQMSRVSAQSSERTWAQLESETSTISALAAPEDRFEDCLALLAQPDALRLARTRARRIAGDEAEDIVQRTILAVCERHARSRIDALLPYFLKSTENLARQAATSGWSSRRCDLQDSICGTDTEQEMLRAQRLAAVQKALCHLEPRQRQVLEGRLDGLSDEEIATNLGTSKENVRQLASRGTSELRTIFEVAEELCKL